MLKFSFSGSGKKKRNPLPKTLKVFTCANKHPIAALKELRADARECSFPSLFAARNKLILFLFKLLSEMLREILAGKFVSLVGTVTAGNSDFLGSIQGYLVTAHILKGADYFQSSK